MHWFRLYIRIYQETVVIYNLECRAEIEDHRSTAQSSPSEQVRLFCNSAQLTSLEWVIKDPLCYFSMNMFNSKVETV